METLVAPIETPAAEESYDTCDRCGNYVQAFGTATKGSLELKFCGHHLNRLSPSLIAAGWEIEDNTHKINEKPMSGIVGEE
jgi:hypothetical protein